MDRMASRELPESYEGLPDLLTMTMAGIVKADKWKHLPHNMADASELWDMFAIVYMGSRRCTSPSCEPRMCTGDMWQLAQ